MIPDGGKSNLTDSAPSSDSAPACSCRYASVFSDIEDVKEAFGKVTEVWGRQQQKSNPDQKRQRLTGDLCARSCTCHNPNVTSQVKPF